MDAFNDEAEYVHTFENEVSNIYLKNLPWTTLFRPKLFLLE